MAIFRLDIGSVARSAGRRATSSAAYRAGERIRDERSGRLYDHTGRRDVLHKEIVLPSGLSGSEVPWAADRAALWNAAEAAEHRKNSRVAREYQVALPSELSPQQRLDLTRAFSRELADRYHVAIDVTIHAPRAGGDPRAYHAHLLATTREVTSTGLGPKASIELGNTERLQRGLLASSDEYKALRARWAQLTNEALREAHLEARVDHRSLAAQGIAREPGPSIPHRFHAMERKGIRSTVAEQIRENYRHRLEARSARSVNTAAEERGALARDGLPGLERAARGPQVPAPAAAGHQAGHQRMEDIQREAAQAWLRYRDAARLAGTVPVAGAASDRSPGRSHTREGASLGRSSPGRDEDHSL